MRFESCEVILEDFFFLKIVIMELDEQYFAYMTKQEIDDEKSLWLEEIKMEYAFKLLTGIEAEIRQEFRQSISSKHRDPLSKGFNSLCDEYRQQKGDYLKSRRELCKKIRLSGILECLVRFYKAAQDSFHSKCSILKGHFSFRNWYAHGRYQYPVAVPDPEDIIDIYDNLKQQVFDRTYRSLHQ